jgi:HKD family nuclease
MLISNITSDHKSHVQKLIEVSDGNFIIVSPFIASDMTSFLENFNFSKLARIELVTTFKPKDAEQLTKPFQLLDFMTYFKNLYPNIKIFIHINNNLHGKLYISGNENKQMIVTSANFTRNGMFENHEWGILLQDQSIIEHAIEEIFESIDYKEISFSQLTQACDFAKIYKRDHPKMNEKPDITCDILKRVYSDNDVKNIAPQYFLKPIGDSDKPITLESRRDYSELCPKLYFSKRRPRAVRKGDILITTAVGAGSLLSYFRVTSDILVISKDEQLKNPWFARWPHYVMGENQSPKFGGQWWQHNLRRQDLLKQFHELYPSNPVTDAGGFTLNTLNRGQDKVKITKEFGDFLISKISQYERYKKND